MFVFFPPRVGPKALCGRSGPKRRNLITSSGILESSAEMRWVGEFPFNSDKFKKVRELPTHLELAQKPYVAVPCPNGGISQQDLAFWNPHERFGAWVGFHAIRRR